MLLILTVQTGRPSSGAADIDPGKAETPQLFLEFPAKIASKVAVWPKYASGPQRADI
jgi:hypothetical protein